MQPARLAIALSSLLLIATFAISIARAASAEIHARAEPDIMRPSFPAHWGPPPRRETRDLVQLPGDYGRGSGTLRKWILEKMAEDDSGAASEKKWPEKDLVGMMGEDAKAAVLAGNSGLTVHVLPQDSMVTMDYREDRVRIFVGDDGKVVRQPKIG
ncbi:hypothetical protein ACHAXT_001463 [Thalassiosira profunda]